MCADVTCYHIFGSPAQAKSNGVKLGQAAAQAMATLIPARAEPLLFAFKSIELVCQPMPTRQWFQQQIESRQQFIDNLERDPSAIWFCGINLPEQMSVPEKIKVVEEQNKYMEPKNKSYILPEGFMERHQNELRKISNMSDYLMKYMYIRVGREQVDNLYRHTYNLTNKSIHIF